MQVYFDSPLAFEKEKKLTKFFNKSWKYLPPLRISQFVRDVWDELSQVGFRTANVDDSNAFLGANRQNRATVTEIKESCVHSVNI